MKTTLLLLSTSLLAVGAAQAQITLTQSNYPATPSTVELYRTTSTAGVTKPTTGANQTWNYSNLPNNGATAQRTYLAPPTNAAFPTATRAYNYVTYVSTVAVNGIQYQAQTSAGLQDLGFSLPQQRFSLSTVTFGPNDSLVIPAQQVVYTGAYLTKYPKTAGSTETYSTRAVSNGIMTVALLGLNRAAVKLVQRTTVVDSVAGWGAMRIPAASGGGSTAAIPVLQRRFRYRTVDSVYINNAPATALQLALLGVQQGQVTWSYVERFSRAGSSQPLISFFYSDKFQTLTDAEFSREADLVTGVRPSLAAEVGGLQAYPNPAADGRLTIAAANGQHLAVTLTVHDLLGRQVATAPATTGQPSDVLRGLAAGSYVVDVQDKKGARSAVKVCVQ